MPKKKRQPAAKKRKRQPAAQFYDGLHKSGDSPGEKPQLKRTKRSKYNPRTPEVAPVDPSQVELVREFVTEFNSALHKTVEGFIECGRVLIRAKAKLWKSSFENMIREQLAVDVSTARKLMLIAENPIICAHVHKLPPAWSTAYELTKVKPPDALQALFDDDTIHPKMERKEAEALHKPSPAADDKHGKCPFCQEKAKDGHEWDPESEANDEQRSSWHAVDAIVKQVDAILTRPKSESASNLRTKIDHIIALGEGLHPQIRGLLADALRELATRVTNIAGELIDPETWQNNRHSRYQDERRQRERAREREENKGRERVYDEERGDWVWKEEKQKGPHDRASKNDAQPSSDEN